MRFYHFTSFGNWEKIMKDREMKEYKIKKCKKSGIFLWKNKLTGISKNGTILHQIATKNTGTVVELEINLENTYNFTNSKHEGLIGEFCYHSDEEALIYHNKIPIECIKLINKYKIEEAFK